MPKFILTECVPQIVRYTKIVEAQDAASALAMIDIDGWAGVDIKETGPWLDGDIIGDCTYTVEEQK